MWSFHRVLHLLLLPTLCLAEYPKIDDELIEKAKAGQWIYLGDEDDTMIKIVRMQNVFHKDISYGEAEQFCEEDRGHLLSVRSQEEDTYISDLALAVYAKDGGASDWYVRFPTGWLGSWSDGSSTDYVRKKLGHKCIWVSFVSYHLKLESAWRVLRS
ncbi:hypothetical protein COOONC_16055 [Cooperia oncophora]